MEERNSTRSSSDVKVTFTKRQIIKNLIVICLGFVLLFIAYNGLSNLQSTLNQSQGIGVASQAIIYAAFCVSSLLLPKYIIKKLGCKYALLSSMICYIPYVAANFHFTWVTMVPSAILVGLVASVLWSSQCTYFNETAVMYSTLLAIEKCKDKLNAESLNNIAKGDNVTPVGKYKPYGSFDCKSLATTPVSDKLDHSMHTVQSMISSDSLHKLTENTEKNICLTTDAKPGLLNLLKKETNMHGFVKNNEINNGENQYSVPAVQKRNSEISIVSNFSKYELGSNDHLVQKGNCTSVKKYKKAYSEEYSKIVSSVTALFFGLFGLAFRTSDIWSNLMSYYVLNDETVLDNITENGNCSCGASFCNVESNCFQHNLAEPNQYMRNILVAVSLVIGVLAVIFVFLFLDEIEEDKQPITFSLDLAMATCRFIKKKEALLLLPLSSYIGVQQGFYIGDFTKSFIACAWGVRHVGLVTIAYGVAAGLSSTLAGFLVKYVGRISVMMIGAVINAGVNVLLLVWKPVPDRPLEFFLAAAVIGVAVGILWSQLRAFYGVIFKKDAECAFAGFYLWDSIGYCLSFSYSNYICTYIKIYILFAVSTIGVFGYLKTEFMHAARSEE